MNKEQFSLSFYLKLLLIFAICLFSYRSYQNEIDAILENTSIPAGQRALDIGKVLLDLPSMDQYEKKDSPSNNPKQNNHLISSDRPQKFDSSITELDNFRYAQAIAKDFNQAINDLALNQSYLALVNESSDLQLKVGNYLSEGSNERVKQLGDYNYFGPKTLEGKDFRSLYPEISDYQYRIGEQLYELYISADDVHVQTWKNEEILAAYLFNQFQQDEALSYQHQFINVYASPSDYQVEEVPYIRLVAVVTYDTE